jgi:hypothetical protein
MMERFVWKPMRWVSSFFCNRETGRQQTEEIVMFAGLPETVSNFQAFANGIHNKIGLLILYTEQDSSYLEGLIQALRSQEYVIDIFVYFYNSRGRIILSII